MILGRRTKKSAPVAVLAVCAVIGAATGLSACSAVLGFDSLSLYPSEGGAPSEGGDDQDGSNDGVAPGEGGNEAATCVADLMNSATHCGRCNHDCLGATCENGQCQPLKLADGLAIPEGLAVGPTEVYVTEYDLNRIVRFGKNALGNCKAAPLPSTCVFNQTSAFKPTAMGIDGASVFWTTTGGSATHEIRSCPHAGCGGSAPRLVASLGQDAFAHLFGNDVLPLELVVKDGLVFWPESNGSALRSAPVNGGAVTTYFHNTSYMPLAIAVDDTHIYFTDDTNQHPTQIQSVPRDGTGAVKVVAATPARPFGLGLTTTGNLYWTVPFISNEGDGLVQASAKTADGGAPVGAVASTQYEPRALIVDAANVYWVATGAENAATGMVLYCPLAGCPTDGPIVLARDQRVPKHITQDATAIYWSNEGLSGSVSYDGQVWKAAKP